jgi:phosphoribosyl 1,2-cyclic phosphodiesterase
MQVKVWGARGSIPSPGPETVRYGGNTSCVQVTLSDGSDLVLDAGTGIRNLGELFDEPDRHIHILLTHLHLDHIQGLLFFSPLFRRQAHVTIWGPSAPGGSLQDRISRYLSAPLTPVEVRELPCELDFLDCPVTEWDLGPARIRAEAVNHRGPTLGFHIADGDATLCYIPDHEPALAGPLEQLEPEWLSGHSLARDVDLLIHDCQYTDEEYASHVGWGHSALSDAVRFAQRSNARQTLLFHHDPHHSDEQLDVMLAAALEQSRELGATGSIEMAAEQRTIEVRARSGAAR